MPGNPSMPTQSAPAQLDQGSLALATSFVEALIAGNAVPNRTTFDATALAGLSVVHVEPGRLVAEMPVRARVQNRYGTLHGGCTATLVDTLTTAALLTVSPLPGVSMVLSVNYVAPMPGTPVPAASLPVPAPSGAATPADDSASVTLSTTPMPALTGTPAARACPAAGPSSSSSGDGGGSGCGGGSGGCEEAGNEEVVVVDARVVKAGRQVATLAAELRRKRTGQLVATGSHTKFLQIQDSAMDRLKQLSGAEKLQAAGGQAPPRSRL